MARRNRRHRGEPWLRTFDNCWYVTIDGVRTKVRDRLGQPLRGKDSEAEVRKIWHEMVAKSNAPILGDENELKTVLNLYLERHLKISATDKTFWEWVGYFKEFCERYPGLLVKELSPSHLREWWATKESWGPSVQNLVGTAMKAALNWAAGAEAGKIIPTNPLNGMKLPRVRSRGASSLISDEDWKKLLEEVPEDLKDVLVMLRETGTRPSNIWRATAANLDAEQGVLIFGDWNTEPGTSVHKTFKKTGEALVVPLTDAALKLCREKASQHPTGPLFRTASGAPWDAQKIANRLAWYKKKLGLDHVCLYGARHTVATRLLLEGVPDAQVAAILGQKGTDMLYRHYGHLGAKIQKLRETLEKHSQVSEPVDRPTTK